MKRLQPLNCNFQSWNFGQKIYLAKILNDKVVQIIQVLVDLEDMSVLLKLLSSLLSSVFDRLNDSYVRLVDQLIRLYETDEILKKITPAAPWKTEKILRSTMEYKSILTKYEEHAIEVKRQWILANSPRPFLSYQICIWINDINQELHLYKAEIDKICSKEKQLRPNYDKILFTCTYNARKGELLINGAKAHQTQAGSVLDDFLEKAQESPGKTVRVEIHGCNLAKTIGNLKIPKSLNKLFFVARTKKTCIFQPNITARMLLEDGVQLDEVMELTKQYPI